MEFEEDYTDYYDELELERQWSSNTKEEEMIDSSQKKNDYQDILFQKSNFYYVMEEHRAEKYVFDLISDLVKEWGFSESFAIKLLRKFAWNLTKVHSHITEDGNFEEMDIQKNDNDKEFDCLICFTTENMSEACSYDCGHYYCRDCFRDYLKLAIEEGQPFKNCPSEGCKEILTPKIVEKYLKFDASIYQKYKKFLLKEVVSASYNLMWCPAPGCLYVICLTRAKKEDDSQSLKNVRCDCGYCFCLKCKMVAHRPLKCEKFQKWMSLLGGKDETLNMGWIKKNTKPCPHCKSNIEKNQGCMHMTCRGCKFEFCWLCLGNWKEHGGNTGGYYNCNKFKESEKKMDDEEREFEKFNFYRDRFEQHWNAINLAVKKKKTIIENFQTVNALVLEMKDDTFLREALDLIIEVRRAITMTYAVSYYSHFDTFEKEMFEMQQSMLWEALDNLDKFTDELQVFEVMEGVLVDKIRDEWHLAKHFSEYKSNLNGRVSAVTAACNKLLRYIEGELQEKENSRVLKKQVSKGTKTQKKSKLKYQSDHWYCAYCTFANEQSAPTCAVCENVKKELKNAVF